MVPVLELTDGTIILESKVIMDFVEDAYPTSGYSLLPADPVVRAKMRIAIAQVDGLNAAYYPILMKKAGNEDDYKKLIAAIQKIEDFIAANHGESPFAQGTENPTQLDIHYYTHLVRIRMNKGSALNDLFAPINFD